MKLVLKIFVWPMTLALSAITWFAAFALSRAAFLFGLASAILTPAALLVLFTTSVKNGLILLAISFFISPLGLPMLAVKLLGGLESANQSIKGFIRG